MPDDLKNCCAFTGHRPAKFPWKYDEKDERCVALKAILSAQIEKLAASGVIDFYTGMAQGVDTWAALAVLALREKDCTVKLHCLRPCEGQDEKWLPPAQIQYRNILSKADSVSCVSRVYTSGCMLERNRRLVDSAGILLAVYNGEKRGGTAATVRYARRAGRRIVRIAPDTLQVTVGKPAPSAV